MAAKGLQLRNESMELGFRDVGLGIWDICICTDRHAWLYFEFSSSVLRMKNVTYFFPIYMAHAYYTGRVGRSWSMSCGFTFQPDY